MAMIHCSDSLIILSLDMLPIYIHLYIHLHVSHCDIFFVVNRVLKTNSGKKVYIREFNNLIKNTIQQTKKEMEDHDLWLDYESSYMIDLRA